MAVNTQNSATDSSIQSTNSKLAENPALVFSQSTTPGKATYFLPVASSNDKTTVSTTSTSQPPLPNPNTDNGTPSNTNPGMQTSSNPAPGSPADNNGIPSKLASSDPGPLVQDKQNIPINLPVLTEKPPGDNVVVKPADQVDVKDPTKSVEYFVSYALTQTVLTDGKTTNIYQTQTFASVRPIAPKASTGCIDSPGVSLLLFFMLALLNK
eukprot:NODE_591_length_6340_cov_0.231533.p3 type:complete len:210 gc:universal NODE_591_length_6340_cov_0.231533:893-1522(+)